MIRLLLACTLMGPLALAAPAQVPEEKTPAPSAKTDPSSPLLETIRYFSFVQHMFSFSAGKVYLKYVVFHLSFGLFWLFLTIRVLESRKWR